MSHNAHEPGNVQNVKLDLGPCFQQHHFGAQVSAQETQDQLLFFTMPIPYAVSGSHTGFGGSLRLNFTGKLSDCKALLGTPTTTVVILVFEALAKIQ